MAPWSSITEEWGKGRSLFVGGSRERVNFKSDLITEIVSWQMLNDQCISQNDAIKEYCDGRIL